MGRPAKPTNLKVLHGDAEHRINRNEPIPFDQPVEPPYPLTSKVQEIWDRLAPDRIRVGVLTHWDVDAFATLCELIALKEEAFEEAHRGVLVEGARSKNERVYNRAMQGVRELTGLLNTLGGRFGWTPADRAKLSITSDEEDVADEYLTG